MRTSLRSRRLASRNPSAYLVERLETRQLLSTTFYVALTGSDSNSGLDPAHPLANIQTALNEATAPGDIVQVAAGTYFGQSDLHFAASGTAAQPITLEAAPGQTVTIDGAVMTSGWTEVGNSSVYTYSNWNHYFAPQATGTDDARSQPRDQLFVDGQYLPEATSLAAMTPGTFYVSPTGTNAISLWLSDGSNPNNHIVKATATAGPLFTTNSGSTWCSYVDVSALQFCDCANIAQAGASEFQANGGTNITIQNVSVEYAAGCGIGLNNTDSTVIGCHFDHNGEEGIGSSGAVNLSVIDCETAYNNTLPSKQFDVIWEAGATKFSESSGVVIDGLVSHDNYGDGLWFDYDNRDATIRNCVISNNFGYGIHYEISWSATIYNNLIFNNHFHYNYQSGVDGYGIFLSSSIGCDVYNNTIVGNDSVGFASSGLARGYFFSYDNQFFNNIVVSNGAPAVLIGDVNSATQTPIPAGETLSQPYAFSDSDYNVFCNAADNPNEAIAGYYTSLAAWQAAGLDTHSQFANPLFVNQSDNQFQLSAGSAALTGGTATWPGVSIQEANPQIVGAHYDTLPTGSDYDNLPVAVIDDSPATVGAGSVTFNVVFTEPVQNVSAAAFALSAAGTASGTISGVSANSGTNFTVTVSSVTGSGSLRLDVLPNVIQAVAGLGKTVLAYNGGAIAAVPLATSPAVTSITPFTTGPTAGNFLQYLVTFNEPVSGLTASNFQVRATGTATGAVVPAGGLFSNPVLGSLGTSYVVMVGPTNIAPIVGDSTNTSSYPGQITGDGTLALNFVDPAANVVDASGNAAPAYESGAVADIDDPAVTLASPANGASNASALPMFSGAAGHAVGDLPQITINIYSGVGASGTPVQTLTTTATNAAYSVAASTALSPGTYTAQASQSDAAGTTGLSTANTFAIPTPIQGGLITGTQSTAAASYNLTTLGTSDWAAWGLAQNANAFDHKATGGSQISNVTKVGSGEYGGYAISSRQVSWSDGSPLATESADDGYIWANTAVGAGYSFTVPAGTGTQTLDVLLGGYSSGSTLTAHLSDGSAADYSVSLSGNGTYTDVVALTYNAASAGQTLTLTYVKSSNINGSSGSADLMAAWLVGPAASTAPVVTTNPASTTVVAGATATFTAAATGNPAPTVQWQYEVTSDPFVTSFTNITGATSPTLEWTASAADNGDEFRAVFSNGVGSPATSAVATLTVTTPTAPAVLTNPTNLTVTAGATASFTATASGNPAPTVQWMVEAAGSTGFSPISGATSMTLNLGATTASETGDEYEAVFSNGIGSPATTTAATLTVNPAPAGSLSGVTSNPAAWYNLTAVGTSDWAHWGTGANVNAFDDKATGASQISNVTRVGSGSYGAYSISSRDVSWTDGTPVTSDSGDDGYIWANNALGAGYSFTVPADTTTRTVYVYLGGYSSGGTFTAKLSDGSAPDYVASLSGNASYNDLLTITYSAASAGQKLTLTWLKSSNYNGTSGSVDLIAAWLVGAAVNTPPAVTSNPASQMLTVGQDVKFSAAATGVPAPTVQWMIKPAGAVGFSPVSGATSTTLDLGPATLAETGNQYEAVFSNGVGSPATTTIANLSVTPATSAGSLSGSSSAAAASYNLTSLGTTDWAHWGLGGSATAFDHKATGGSQISNVTKIGSGDYGGYTIASRKVSWTGGTPVATESGDDGYIWANNAIGAGYSFTVPASTTAHTLYLYLGGYSSGSTLTAHLSDGSAADYSLELSGSGTYTDLVTITYNAASAGQTLTLTYVKSQNIDGTSGSADLIAAALQ
jgi:parallel beta-helix repeat protein